MGWYIKYFSTLLKGLGATSFKMRIETRRLVINLKKQDHDLYKKIRSKVEEHRVTSALQDANHFIKEVQKSAENAEKLLFNVITVEQQAVKAEIDILKAIKELSQKTRGNKTITQLEREFALSMYNGIKKAEGEEREEYKMLMQVIDEAHLHHKDFMEMLRLRFQKETSQSILTKFAIRGEIRREKNDIIRLQKIEAEIRNMAKRIHGDHASKNDEDYIIKHLKAEYETLADAVEDVFYQSYLIKKRDLFMMLKILFNLHTLREWLVKWSWEHNLPLSNVKDEIRQIKNLEDNIGKELQPIAQGFRIIIHAIDGIQSEALGEVQELK